MVEPGLDKHAWETEWQALEPLVVDSPGESLPELDNLIERIMRGRGYPVDEENAWESNEPEIVAEFLAAREVTQRVQEGEDVGPGDLGEAIASYRNLYEFLLQDYIDLG